MKLKILIICLFIQFIYIPLIAENMSKKIGQQIFIKAGTYFIGSNKEKENKPLREMHFKGFYIDIHPVTNGQYIIFLNKTNYEPEGEFSVIKAEKAKDFPATGLTYKDAEAYAEFFKQRLPTEWEFEIASRSCASTCFDCRVSTASDVPLPSLMSRIFGASDDVFLVTDVSGPGEGLELSGF